MDQNQKLISGLHTADQIFVKPPGCAWSKILSSHFTLLQAFCCENDISILRVSNPARLAELLRLPPPGAGPDPPADLHCVLVTNPYASQWKDPALSQLMCFCRESRYMDQWVPVVNLPDR
ncbi:growth arrest and DNA damage-inducible protein GADD45 alpha [Alligator sinensis]|uniref:Growth arrest and DNA damage-inducible protein GADD45 alpha n=1 Tax=Alligator sinensis TaxID=38654 RepID=A0A3Q0H9B9_ALLSI|nr:growth arrest and DNA damage-inducible protein GADD45 alpha [Alligator sinensis]